MKSGPSKASLASASASKKHGITLDMVPLPLPSAYISAAEMAPSCSARALCATPDRTDPANDSQLRQSRHPAVKYNMSIRRMRIAALQAAAKALQHVELR